MNQCSYNIHKRNASDQIAWENLEKTRGHMSRRTRLWLCITVAAAYAALEWLDRHEWPWLPVGGGTITHHDVLGSAHCDDASIHKYYDTISKAGICT
jgi:hypothetical protein